MPETMRAVTFVRPYRISVGLVPLPEPAPGEVLVALEGTGVCASNLPLFEGAPWMQYPMPPGTGGHEGWGRVAHVGEGVDTSWVGRRVAALSFKAYAEYDVARADQIVALPRHLDERPFPGEALGCAMNIFARADIRQGQTVAIVGSGFLGALLVRLASRAGARVIALSRRESALDIARSMGAHERIQMNDHYAIIEQVKELTKGRFCERVVEATGKQWPLDLSAELTGEYGKLVIAGYHQDGPRQVNMQLWNWRCLDVINAHERNPQVSMKGMRAAVDAVSEGWLDPEPLYTKRYALSDLAQAFQDMSERPDGFIKALVVTGGGQP